MALKMCLLQRVMQPSLSRGTLFESISMISNKDLCKDSFYHCWKRIKWINCVLTNRKWTGSCLTNRGFQRWWGFLTGNSNRLQPKWCDVLADVRKYPTDSSIMQTVLLLSCEDKVKTPESDLLLLWPHSLKPQEFLHPLTHTASGWSPSVRPWNRRSRVRLWGRQFHGGTTYVLSNEQQNKLECSTSTMEENH